MFVKYKQDNFQYFLMDFNFLCILSMTDEPKKKDMQIPYRFKLPKLHFNY